MPVYDFKCKDCGEVQEILVRSHTAEPKCLRCGSANMERLFTIRNYTWKWKYPMWVDRMDDHQKRQVDRGEQPTVPHIKEVL